MIYLLITYEMIHHVSVKMVLKKLIITSFSVVISQTKDMFSSNEKPPSAEFRKLLFGDPNFSEEEDISLLELFNSLSNLQIDLTLTFSCE